MGDYKRLFHKRVLLALLYFPSASVYKASLDDELCHGLFAFYICHFAGEKQIFVSYRTEFGKACFSFFERKNVAATAAKRALCIVSLTQVTLRAAEEMEVILEQIVATRRLFNAPKKAAEKPLNPVRNTFATQ